MSYVAASARVRIDIEALDRERQLRGWTWAQMAQAAGIDPGTLRRVCRSGFATAAVFNRLADALATHPALEFGAALRKKGND